MKDTVIKIDIVNKTEAKQQTRFDRTTRNEYGNNGLIIDYQYIWFIIIPMAWFKRVIELQSQTTV